MGEAIITVGFFLFAGASLLSVLEEWPKQGLTDTSYLTLVLWVLGGVVVSIGAIILLMIGLACVGSLAAAIAGYGIQMKLYDHRHMLKHLIGVGRQHKG